MIAGASRIEVVGHGGAGDFYPANSLASIEKALALGVDRIECDVQRSASGDLVLVHDKRIHDESGAHRRVARLSTVEIRRFLPGVLLLEELFEVVGGVPVMIDLKFPGYEAAVIAAVRAAGDRCDVSASSTHPRSLIALRAAFPTMRLGLSTGHIASGFPIRCARGAVTSVLERATPVPLAAAARLCRATDVMVQYLICTPRLVRHCHERGLRVAVWTVNEPARLAHAVELGVDAIISNRPDLAFAALCSMRTAGRSDRG